MAGNLKTGELVSFSTPTGMRRALLVRLDVFEATVQTMDGERLTIDADLIRGRGGEPGKAKRVAARAAEPPARADESVVELDDETPTRRGFKPQPKPLKPARSGKYLDYVRALPCCSCGARGPSDPHHYGPRGVGQKTDDTRTVPLCRRCHDVFHDSGLLPALDKASTRLVLLQKQVDLLVAFIRHDR